MDIWIRLVHFTKTKTLPMPYNNFPALKNCVPQVLHSWRNLVAMNCCDIGLVHGNNPKNQNLQLYPKITICARATTFNHQTILLHSIYHHLFFVNQEILHCSTRLVALLQNSADLILSGIDLYFVPFNFVTSCPRPNCYRLITLFASHWQSHVKCACRGCSSMVEQKLPKLTTRVRFPSPAPAYRS
jgi:hypothetical protein